MLATILFQSSAPFLLSSTPGNTCGTRFQSVSAGLTQRITFPLHGMVGGAAGGGGGGGGGSGGGGSGVG